MDPSQKLLGSQVTPGGALPNVPGAANVAAQMGGNISAADVPQIEHLGRLPALFVRQRIDWLEMFADYDVSNTYEVFLTEDTRRAGASWLLAKEQSECLQRVCFPMCREFTMDVGIPGGRSARTFEEQLGLVPSQFVIPMFRIHRPCFFCLPSFEIADGRGQNIANGKEECTSLIPCLPTTTSVYGPGKQTMEGPADYTFTGPSRCMISCIGRCPCRGDLIFDYKSSSGENIGLLANESTGWLRMCCTTADDYRVEFSSSAKPTDRATLLALAFLTDFRYFEVKQRKQGQGGANGGFYSSI